MKKKRILSLLLSMIVCIAMMPVAVFADETGGVLNSLRSQEMNRRGTFKQNRLLLLQLM